MFNEETITRIVEEYLKTRKYENTSTILFGLKATYGEQFDVELAAKIINKLKDVDDS